MGKPFCNQAAQLSAGMGLEQDLATETSAQAIQWSRCRTKHLDPQFQFLFEQQQQGGGCFSPLFYSLFRSAGDTDGGKKGKGWVAGFPAKFQLLVIKTVTIVVNGTLDGIMSRIERLQQYPSRGFAPTGPTENLGKNLESSLRTAEVRHVQACFGTDYTHQGYTGEIMSLRDHLGTDQDVRRAVGHAGQQTIVAPLAGSCVAVHAQDASLGEQFRQIMLDAFSTGSQLL